MRTIVKLSPENPVAIPFSHWARSSAYCAGRQARAP
jgi:hypothetical protein